MSRFVSFRFDVDTELCLREGVPRLLDLGEKLGVCFTFFVNPGRAIRRRDVLVPDKRASSTAGAKLSFVDKLGLRESAYLFLINPRTLPKYGSVLRGAQVAGHDIGLHGGRNHGGWARNAHRWSVRRLEYEVDFGVQQFQQSGLGSPKMFASPGWNSPKALPAILAARGVKLLADSHGPRPKLCSDERQMLKNIHTAVTGEPGGIGYLEFMRASGHGDDEILRDFTKRLEAKADFACVYDHPFYVGRKEISLLESLVSRARDNGWDVVPLNKLIDVSTFVSNQ